MKIRERYEIEEKERLSKYASKASESLGRKIYDQPCDIRTDYQKDRDRIIHSKSFRRLKHKTQVFLTVHSGDHHRTRLTHTLEVAQISRTIARGLRLNEDLTEAIALGHDLGHTPFGHAGENVLNGLASGGFNHNFQSIIVVEKLENEGKGLNLTKEVLDGILNHTGKTDPFTLEGKIVKIADRIAYINHDIDDATRAGILKIEEIPKKYLDVLGYTHSKRINTLVKDMIESSYELGDIKQSELVRDSMLGLRSYLFEYLYLREDVTEKFLKAEKIVELLYNYYIENPNKMEIKYNTGNNETNVINYISGMTDNFAIQKFKDLYLP